MFSDSRFVIIAGTARNVGKTTLACRIIKQNSSKNIIALKFVTLKEGGQIHSHHSDVKTYSIIEETNLKSSKDTVKMLKSGAKKAYLIVSKEEFVEKALSEFIRLLDNDDFVIVESATLRNYIIPRKFIIVDREGAVNKKEYIKALVPLADILVKDVFSDLSITVL